MHLRCRSFLTDFFSQTVSSFFCYFCLVFALKHRLRLKSHSLPREQLKKNSTLKMSVLMLRCYVWSTLFEHHAHTCEVHTYVVVFLFLSPYALRNPFTVIRPMSLDRRCDVTGISFPAGIQGADSRVRGPRRIRFCARCCVSLATDPGRVARPYSVRSRSRGMVQGPAEQPGRVPMITRTVEGRGGGWYPPLGGEYAGFGAVG